MKPTYHVLLPLFLTITLSTPISAEDLTNESIQNNGSGTDRLSTYLLNLGAFLGYDLTNTPPSSTPPSPLTNMTAIQNPEQSLFETMLGAIPVNAISTAFSAFVPKGDSAESINAQANATFTTPPYSTATQDGNVTVNKLIDQLPYQPDPVSQAVLNILETPDSSFCMNNDGTEWTGGSTGETAYPYPTCIFPLNANAVTNNVIGTTIVQGTSSVLPKPSDFFRFTYNQQFLSQLNSNVLIAPLLYSTAAEGQSTTSSQSDAQNGLPAQSQAQQAANFIRYASGAVVPLVLPSRKAYDDIYKIANSGKNDLAQAQAQSTLSTYLASLRVYAAQSSVAFSNLYYILSKRLPQNVVTTSEKSSNQPKSSQALSEFKMATWRILNTDQSTNTAWLTQINQASSATVQKEIVTLLAEINYQLYLTRQQEERMLLTNTMLLLLSTHSTAPTTNLLTAQNPNSP